MFRILLCVALAGFALPAAAQDDQTPPRSQFERVAILTVDIDRLFNGTQFGERVAREFNTDSAALAEENRRIAEALRAEELALAEARPDMEPESFRAAAEDFDEKAQGIRRAQDAKERALENALVEARDQFLIVSRPVLGQLMLDRGAFVIVDRRSVVLSLGSIDVTDDAIARIDAEIGEGDAVDLPEPAPEDEAIAPAPEPPAPQE